MSEIDFEKIAERFCDDYCKFPHLCNHEEVMKAVCAGCPIRKLEEMIDE